jgi:hypothetical protein
MGDALMEALLSVLFLVAVGLAGGKINSDFGDHGLRGYALLLLITGVLAGLVGLPYA